MKSPPDPAIPPNTASGGRGAIVYDFFLVPGGAEHVTVEIAHLFPDADVIVGATSSDCRELTAPIQDRLVTLHRHIPGHPLARALWAMRAFKRFAPSLADYDWVLFSGSFAPMAATQRRNKRNLLYCHTIPRFAYDLRSYYRERLGTVRRPLFDWFVKRVRMRYQKAISQMSRIAANSSNTQQRLKRFLHADADIIYPPCNTAEFTWQGVSDYFLSTARLEPYKRVDVVIDAFLRMPDKKLVVASGGSNEASLRRQAGGAENIVFTGWLSRAGMAELLAKCIASIYIPKDEDFGLSPVESMAAGKPVIGVAEGGLRETVVDGETGCLLAPDPTVEAVIDALTTMTPEKAFAMRHACEARALLFGSERFRDEIRALVGAG